MVGVSVVLKASIRNKAHKSVSIQRRSRLEL